MDMDQALNTFIAESHELLDDMEAALLSLHELEDTGDAVNAIFRAAHTMKGSAGLFGLDHVVAFTHVAESVLDEVRAGHVFHDEPLIALLLQSGDHMRALINALAAGQTEPDPALEAQAMPLVARLKTYLAADAVPQRSASKAVVTMPEPEAATLNSGSAGDGNDHWHISLRFGLGVMRNGMDPLSFLRYLGTIGRIVGIVTLPDALPNASLMDPECCYLGFEIAFQSAADKATIEGVFEFVLDDCALRILPPRSRIDEYVALIEALPEEPARLGEILARCGSVTEHEINRALKLQSQEAPQAAEPQRLGAILVEQGGVEPAVVQAALEKQQKTRDAKARENQSVRVDSDKLDRLIDLVGELIIAQAGASLAAKRTADLELHEAHSTLASLVQDLRDSALQLRMVKIGPTFTRFQRVVHDVSRELGKEIQLVIHGEETELDKTLVEKIGDPLTHLVRNALDHGIADPEYRIARGKPARGTLTLNAYHDSGSIVIEVTDDGRGLNRDKILAKAIERGLVDANKSLSDAEIYNLIFEPGFSTAEQVTNLSGRGVGMDVVKRNITALRGSVSVHSTPGRGTTIAVRLPLTLAIIEGFQVGIGSSVFVVPLDMIEECIEYRVEPARADVDYTDLRGEVLPLIRLREIFELGGTPGARQNIVVLRHARQKVGLVVDALLGEAQTVIKPLSKLFAQVKGISGSSIRGSGDVALILDVPALIRQAQQNHSATPMALAK